MARNAEDIVREQIGTLALQNARLVADNEALQEKIAAMEAERDRVIQKKVDE